MASVWVARLRGKHGFENLVAIKTILPQHAGDPVFETMAMDEARIVAAIRHPNVASILDVGEHKGMIYLVFEWVDGEQLSALRRAVVEKRKKFPIAVALRIMADVCAGLHAAHELTDAEGWPLCIVHRDISPQNLLVGTSGAVKIIDFGIAKALDRLVNDTSTGMVKGKALYMAPEQARGDQVDRRVDVWSAGVVLYQLIAERLPIEGPNQSATIALVAAAHKPAPLPAEVPQPIVDVVNQALAPGLGERFQTAGEMHRAIEGALARVYGPVTTGDVAAFLLEHVADRNHERKKLLHAAMEESRNRIMDGGGSNPDTPLPLTPPLENFPDHGTAGNICVTLPSADRPTRREGPARVAVMPSRGGRRRKWAAGLASASILLAGVIGWKVNSMGEAAAQSPPAAALPAASPPVAPSMDPEPQASAESAPASSVIAAAFEPGLAPSVIATSSAPAARAHLPASKTKKEPRNVFDSRR